ncbi:MAG: hypothetical protein M1826_001334 [Phylliscum demangeonii]|nr:MAG: hypothetical protein M1826_001334 [Phylliscum demangeonii]
MKLQHVRSFLAHSPPWRDFTIPPLANHSFRCHASSYRRTKKKLVIKPEGSFLNLIGTPAQDHIVFNPPSSAPSIYHTPMIFLPKDDPRRNLFAPAARNPSVGGDPASNPPPLPPPLTPPKEKRYHLTQDDMVEIRRLRQTDPDQWTRAKLAKKFKCSSLFVGIVCEATKEHKEEQLKRIEDVKARWGRRRTMAREDRKRRRALWGRDE